MPNQNLHTSFLNIEIVYALPDKLTRLTLNAPEGTTIEEALVQSNLFKEHPELSLDTITTGIYGDISPLNQKLNNNDRIEIYRPLKMDPKTRRRNRHAAKQKLPSKP